MGEHDTVSILQDVRERMVRVEEKVDHLSRDREKLDQVNDKARDALALAQENARDIAEIKADSRRSWGVIIGMGTSFIGSILIYFLTK
ncbi:hemolysin XhlA family protein [Brevibacillus laterosporus]|uniref:Hemolysin XhlA family protein n=1 Tax=Brevibacillus laterosporus TaxID=1465 RepID=A0AAP3DLB8_BRELA|nr:hemolysin XhlA family protein [Brevibacillus laterosporus]ATO51046.1 holin [Brevibacillus laterosporus DSM 25]MBG9774206.1 holin [Brevibacillus laterosporus]MCR8979529.1 hemolysin XhlA family protein [Brevibacillus laterosporus]MCR8983408.1 hemolysin XhlA family protein [Brevibacillus laterosporus]MCZ0806684.1 hemolysin XhlA family protein [Brevibacillus laterosporus]